VEELRPGLWTWTAPHPDWTPEEGEAEGWERDVRSYAVDTGDAFVLVDPLAPPSLVDELAAGRPVAVVLTRHFHERSAAELVERLGARVYAPAAGLDRVATPATAYAPGDELPGGLEAKPTAHADEVALWIPSHRALVFADAMLGGAPGLRVQSAAWLQDVTRDEVYASLRRLLDLPVALVLLTHGNPVVDDAPAALQRALA
jgi:glyoxylase-like metal-dependent hydrolase (beta-lactamase superfamily II)